MLEPNDFSESGWTGPGMMEPLYPPPSAPSPQPAPMMDEPAPARKRKRRKPSRPKARKKARRSRSEEHTSELQSLTNLVCRLLLEKKKETQSKCINKKK